jgi:hypothetical protein
LSGGGQRIGCGGASKGHAVSAVLPLGRACAALLLAAGLAGCVPPPPIGPQPGLFWSERGWSVNRYPLPGGFYCTAVRDTFGPDLAFIEPAGGAIGWNVTDTTHSAVPGQSYPVDMVFQPGGTLHFTAYIGAPTRLTNQPMDPATAEAFPRLASLAAGVAISSPVLGPLGRFELSGSAAAIAALDRCAHGAM